jgi:hypothetical protein
MPKPESKPKKPFRTPQLRVFTEATEIPDSFPRASALRRAGYRTYLAILTMPREELVARKETIGADVVEAVLALRPVELTRSPAQ